MEQRVNNTVISPASVLSMARMIEDKDPYTAGHTWRVANYGQILADALNYSRSDLRWMALAGTLHDLGKVLVPDAILTKPGRLSDDELAIMKHHPQSGYEMLKDHKEFEGVLDVVRFHHEAYDGSGYPLGLISNQIPEPARLFAIVDAFDAMTSTRCYRPAMSTENAAYEIWRNRGQQFDPVIADIFLQLYRCGMLNPIIGRDERGAEVPGCACVTPVDPGEARGVGAGCPVSCPVGANDNLLPRCRRRPSERSPRCAVTSAL